jgi:hypothetical protein
MNMMLVFLACGMNGVKYFYLFFTIIKHRCYPEGGSSGRSISAVECIPRMRLAWEGASYGSAGLH